MMELFNLVPVREAVRDGHWMVPTLNGAPRLEKPPIPVWLPGSLAALFGSDSLWIVRLPSVLMGLISCWATYAIGCLLSKDRKLGLWAALILAANIIFIHQSRLASYDIFSTGFITVGFLGLVGLAEAPSYYNKAQPAQSPNRAERLCRRFAWHWVVLTGLGFGLAVLSKGPVPVATIAIPYAVWLLIFHRHRADIWLNIFIAALISILVFLPWLLAAAAQQPQAWKVWRSEFLQFTAAEGEEYRAVWYYYFGFFGFIFPWCISFIGALALPFLPSQSDPQPTDQEKRGRWLMLIVLVLGLVMLSIPHEKKQRYALQQLPVAALMIAALWQEFSRLRRSDLLGAPAKLLLSAQAVLTIGTGVAAVLLIFLAQLPGSFFEQWAARVPHGMRAGLLAAPDALHSILAVFGIAGWAAIGALIILIGSAAVIAQNRHRFSAAFVAHLLAAWLIMLAIYWTYRVGDGFQTNEYRQTAEAIDHIAGKNPIYSLPKTIPWLNTLYYANRTMPETKPEIIIAQAQKWNGPIFVLARYHDKPADWQQSQTTLEQIAKTTGRHMELADEFNDGLGVQILYRLDLPLSEH